MKQIRECRVVISCIWTVHLVKAFDVDGQLPDEYVIDLTTTLQAIMKVKTNKATGPDNIPAWILKNHAIS